MSVKTSKGRGVVAAIMLVLLAGVLGGVAPKTYRLAAEQVSR